MAYLYLAPHKHLEHGKEMCNLQCVCTLQPCCAYITAYTSRYLLADWKWTIDINCEFG